MRVHEQYLNQQSEQTQSGLSIAGHQLDDSSPLSIQTSSSTTQLHPVQAEVPIKTDQGNPPPVEAQTAALETTSDQSTSPQYQSPRL
ncbi:MAG: hypothetical protein CM1200mP28_16120 [Deltaproteobacteria bacterium]|nr:MAG: hypothetical protein CM1200mP28_16120 [Deltaproteobacteria bacterium]